MIDLGRKNGRGKGKTLTDFSNLIKIEEKNIDGIKKVKEKEE